MKSRAPFLFLFFILTMALANAQPGTAFKSIDQHARKAPRSLNSVQELTEYLLQPVSADQDKARSIFAWIRYHIAYDYDAYNDGNRRINKNNQDILNRRRAVCFGYASLFEEMCALAGLPCVRISGYSKGTLTSAPEQNEPDHAWNAVYLDGSWYLVDITWSTEDREYFLTPPTTFILDHLPADPMWQLLECPLSYAQFWLRAPDIKIILDTLPTCFSYLDSIQLFFRLSIADRALKTAKNTHRFFPSRENQEELGHSLVDYAGRLSDVIDRMDPVDSLERIVDLQQRAINAISRADNFVGLYDWQKELFIGLLLNQAVALYNRATRGLEGEAPSSLKAAGKMLSIADKQIVHLKQGLFKKQAREQIQGYTEAIQSALEYYRK